jgi:hypothetical protein
MPAKSESQRRYLAAKFGPEWMKRHHFVNPGRLPKRVSERPPSLLDPLIKRKAAK